MHPVKTVAALLVASATTACATYAGSETSADLVGGEWVVEQIAAHGVIDDARTTLAFAADGNMYGDTACNRYFAQYEASGGDIEISEAGSTRRACVPAVMDQEQRFLAVLNDVESYQFDSTGALVLSTSQGVNIVARKSTDPMATTTYQCTDGSIVEASYPTTDKAIVSYQGRTIEMDIAVSASGSRYVGGNMQWWTTGMTEGMLAPLANDESIASARGINCIAR